MKLTSDERVLFAQAAWQTFEKRRGRPGEMSSAEFDLICQWIKKGIPLPVVLRGIEETAWKPRTLHACGPAVTRAFEYYFTAIGGGDEPIGSEEEWPL